jgi:hypothetical protein
VYVGARNLIVGMREFGRIRSQNLRFLRKSLVFSFQFTVFSLVDPLFEPLFRAADVG